MFENIGSKIKTVTKVFTIIGIVGCITSGIIILCTMDSNGLEIGLSLMIGGPFVCWLESLMTYGLGQLIENSDKQIALENNILNELKKQQKPASVNPPVINKNDEVIVENKEEAKIKEQQQNNGEKKILYYSAVDLKIYNNLVKFGDNESLAYDNIISINNTGQYLRIEAIYKVYYIEYNSMVEAKGIYEQILANRNK